MAQGVGTSANCARFFSGGVSVKFEWDPRKAASNLSKHGVAFEEGLSVFSARKATTRERKDYEENVEP